MQTYVAEVGEIVRSHRRDEEEIADMKERMSRVVKELAGQRAWMRLYPWLEPASKTLYYSATLLSGVQTLGEEYVCLVAGSFLPSGALRPAPLSARALFLLLHCVGPQMTEATIARAARHLAHPSSRTFCGVPLQGNAKARASFQALIEWLRDTGLPSLRRLHLALFYLHGAFYHMSRRAAGLGFRSLSPQTDLQALRVYRWLAYLTLAQMGVSVAWWLGARMEEERRRGGEREKKKGDGETRDREEERQWGAFRCAVCLESRPPAATPCGHLFCWYCIMEHSQTGDESRCPQCRQAYEPSQIVPLLNL